MFASYKFQVDLMSSKVGNEVSTSVEEMCQARTIGNKGLKCFFMMKSIIQGHEENEVICA